ncbi:MAG: 6,7-dimethyl-8-ribityllumazine synthase [Planctomycetota bacterium]
MVHQPENQETEQEIPGLEFSGPDLRGDAGSIDGTRFSIVVSTYHWDITGKLLAGAISTLRENGVADEDILIARVPGAWELPLASSRVVDGGEVDAVICLGCVIRGETTHDQHINTTVSNELGRLSGRTGIPIGFGLLTCNTVEQATARAGGDVGNKGEEAAIAAINMVRLFEQLDGWS